MVKLKAKDTNAIHSFEIGHAENILRLANSQWELADETIELKGDAIIRKKNKKADRKAEASGNNKACDTPSEQD